MKITLLDGPMGTQLLARGIPTPLPAWSANALIREPEAVADLHRDYAAAGATVHTSNTFRTRSELFPERWEELSRLAVSLARDAVPSGQRVAGSIAPLADCYRPDLSPAEEQPEQTRAEHGRLARVLAEAGCDLLLCESFPHPGEGLLAVEAAVQTGVETWCAFTPGWDASLLTPRTLADAARGALDRGAVAVLVNCLPIARGLAYVEALAQAVAGRDAAFGCYANAGVPDEQVGWAPSAPQIESHTRAAADWIDAGATIVGGCCGTSPEHIAALAERFVGPGQGECP
ncbi:MAG TPA: homocysteine S-methyltransferase family protein [Planctomycetota bacterium]|nr:homocysteine S-methyltransferase family protein [Planctomycetota bacterium]